VSVGPPRHWGPAACSTHFLGGQMAKKKKAAKKTAKKGKKKK
jgi:hypothetical protein